MVAIHVFLLRGHPQHSMSAPREVHTGVHAGAFQLFSHYDIIRMNASSLDDLFVRVSRRRGGFVFLRSVALLFTSEPSKHPSLAIHFECLARIVLCVHRVICYQHQAFHIKPVCVSPTRL